MGVFPTAAHLASWAGTAPNNESAGRIKSSKTREGNPYLNGCESRSAREAPARAGVTGALWEDPTRFRNGHLTGGDPPTWKVGHDASSTCPTFDAQQRSISCVPQGGLEGGEASRKPFPWEGVNYWFIAAILVTAGFVGRLVYVRRHDSPF